MKKQSTNPCLGISRFCGSMKMECLFASAAILLALCGQVQAQRITGVEPAVCAVGDNLTITGEKLGDKTVTGVILAVDGKNYPAEIAGKTPDNITVKVPQVPPATYKLGLKIGKDNIYVDPVEVTVK